MSRFRRLFPALALIAFAVPLFAAPKPLFDGKTLDLWESSAPLLGGVPIWRVEDGAITGGSQVEKVPRNEFLATKASYANFDLRLKIKISGKEGFINSGVQIRSVRVPNNSEMSGYQVDAGVGWWGKLYDESRRNKVIGEPKDAAAVNAAVKPDDWNEYRIRTDGARIQSWINGVAALDYTEADPAIAQDGHIGLQVHGGGKALVQFKDISIEELPATPNAPTWEKVGRPGEKKPKAEAKPLKLGNASAVGPRTPEEELATFTLPEGLEAELVAAEIPEQGIGKFIAVYFDQKGAMWTMTALEYPVDGNENPAAAAALYASRAKDKILVYDRADSRGGIGAPPMRGGDKGASPLPASALTGGGARSTTSIGEGANATTAAAQPLTFKKPRVFADGLAIPLGILPYKDGCYAQHGPDIVFLRDTDGDGRADKREVILTGFGVQDSHLFPHQFTRAPGGWIWMAQGAFNYGKVSQPGKPERAQQFDQTRMAKFRPDGSDFTITSQGPCNIWGLVINAEGEAFIQEANDFGYPVMPFHEYANYPGCSDRQWKSYAPEFPGTAPDFKMGGTGLSGLCLTDKGASDGKMTNDESTNDEKRGSSPHSSSVIRHSSFPTAWQDVMLVANPITNRIQGIKMHRDGPRWRLDKPVDFLVSSDPWFRPIALTLGPDGCVYVVDWYNKIISHNEVARNHPDRDKIRGRIWRIRPKTGAPFEVPDFTKLSGDELIGKLGGPSLAQHHLAWQTLADRELLKLDAKLADVVSGHPTANTAARIGALWARRELGEIAYTSAKPELLRDQNASVRREAVELMFGWEEYEAWQGGGQLPGLRSLSPAGLKDFPAFAALMERANDDDPQVRAAFIKGAAQLFEAKPESDDAKPSPVTRRHCLNMILQMARAPLAEPVAPSTRNGKPIKVREAYDREFERYLVRMFLERHPDDVAKFLDSDQGKQLPLEARLLASLALEPKASAARVAALLPQLTRPPEREEILRLVQFLDEPGVADAVRATLANPNTAPAVLAALLELRSKLDPAKLAPLVADAATKLLASADAAQIETGIKLAGAFKISAAEPALVALARGTTSSSSAALRALGDLGSTDTALFSDLAANAAEPQLREAALAALASSKAADAPQRVLALFPKLSAPQRRAALDRLTTTKAGAAAVVALAPSPMKGGGIGAPPMRAGDKGAPPLPASASTGGGARSTTSIGGGADATTANATTALIGEMLDAATLDRLLAVLGDKDPALNALIESLGSFFRPVLALDGSDGAWIETGLTLEGAFSVETWVRLDDGIGNADGILGANGQLDINFYDGQLRVYAFPPLGDVVIAKKKTVAGMWTHVAATRDAAGNWKLYLDGELSAVGTKPAGHKIENAKIGWTSAPGGTQGQLAEFRIWKSERTADQIRANFDRSMTGRPIDASLKGGIGNGLSASEGLFTLPTSVAGNFCAGAKFVRTSDLPPVLTADAAAQLDAKFSKLAALAAKPGDVARGKTLAALCQACHLFGTTGGQIGPNLSGVGAMGAEAILRNILTPNAAMESAYRVYRVEQRDGSVLDAFFVSEDKDAVIIRLPGGPDQRVAKKEITRTSFLRRSLMPEGLLDGLNDGQISDLFAYLLSLK